MSARRLPRQAWLAVIAMLHAAVLLGWRSTVPLPLHTPQRASEVVYLQAPVPRRAVPVPTARAADPAAPAAPVRRAPSPPPPAIRSASAPAAAEQAAPVAEAVTVPAEPAAPDPFALPGKAPDSTLERARHAAAGVDRQLRKESLNKFATYIQPDTKLGTAISKAQTKEWVLQQTSDIGDGVTMKRYRKGNQEYCEYTNLVGARGQDPFRDGNKTKVMTCP
ncbi:hypothetical protein [Pseudoduganella sp.]|uniref:hypothetical protein n=1 Tax=Pseudoduganella sp. TaxID=1880898 RepID=UPI0035AFDC1F